MPISWWYWVAMVGQAGGRVVEPDGRVSLGGAAGEEALRFWQRLVNVDRVMRPPPGRDYQAWQSTNESFLRERVAMMWSSTAYVRYLEGTARFPVVAAPLPRRVRASVPTGGTMFVLMRAAPEEEKRAAWEFVRWMCEDEQTIAWSTRTGYMPVTRSAVERLTATGWYARHPNDRVAYDQLAAVDPWPWAPDLFRVERDVVEPRLEDAVLTGRDAGEVMAEARAEARRGPAMTPARPRWHPWAMLAPTLALLVVFFVVPIGVAACESLFSWDLLTPPRFVGAANYRAPRRARRAPAHRAADARLQRARRRRHDVARPRRWRSCVDRPGRFFALVRASIFSAYVVSWVAVALLWMGLFDRSGGFAASGDSALGAPRRCALRRHLEARRVRDDPLPRRSAGRPAVAARGRGARRRRRLGALPPRDAPAARCRPPRSSRRRRSSRASRRSTSCGS